MNAGTLPETQGEPQACRYKVSVEQYVEFRRSGFLIVPGLVPAGDVDELRQHTEDLMQGRLPEQQETAHQTSAGARCVVERPPDHLTLEEKAQHFLRIHMLHRKLALHERYLLHPRVLDVVEVLIGPDVLALQTMLFIKGPGKPGQGWHQDSYYIPTHPDSLIGAWIAIDDCDEINGAMWFAAGSQVEPVYPPADDSGFGNVGIAGIERIRGASDPNDDENDLSRVASRYPQLLGSVNAGDVVFFGGHVLHRSKQNFSSDRFRRSFVSHYCNARSFTQWGAASAPSGDPHAAETVDPITGMTNASHILARGDTHLPFAQPRFGTPCAATMPPDQRSRARAAAMSIMAGMDSGMMEAMPADPDRTDGD